MKNQYWILAAFAALALACGQKETVPGGGEAEPDPQPQAGAITLASTGNVIIDAAGGSKTVTFSATKAWTAAVSAEADWLSAQPLSGEAGQSLSVTLTASENTAYEQRSATLTLTCEEDVKSVTVLQAAAEKPYAWPNSQDAFDYNLAPGEARQAKLIGSVLNEQGIYGENGKRSSSSPVVCDGVTYGPGSAYYGNRFTLNSSKVGGNGAYLPDGTLPDHNYISFQVNRPGAVSFSPRVTSNDLFFKYKVLVVKTIKGEEYAQVASTVIPETASSTESDHTQGTNYVISLPVTAEDLRDIEEPATIYIYHTTNQNGSGGGIGYYNVTWTSSGENPPTEGRKAKFSLAGDSVCTEYGESSAPQGGWGQHLAEALGHDAVVLNHARGGESTKSFINNGRWATLIKGVFPGDVVIISFGINDRYSSYEERKCTLDEYKNYLRQMVEDVKARQGIPVLATSTRTYRFVDGIPQDTLPEYPQGMRDVATEKGVYLIDLYNLMYDWLLEIGPEGAKPYFVLDKKGGNDTTHITHEGAVVIAGMVANGVKEFGLWEK